MQSIEFNTKLVKLHLQWPDRRKYLDSEEEPLEFFMWLFVNYHDQPEVEQLEHVEDVEEFLKQNTSVLQAKKATGAAKNPNARLEPRIENDVKVSLVVDECDEQPELVGVNLEGRTINLGLHGMLVRMETSLPEGSSLSLKLVTEDELRFELSVETKWARELEDGQKLVGFRILETDSFESWQSQFGALFVSPKIARDYKKNKSESE